MSDHAIIQAALNDPLTRRRLLQWLAVSSTAALTGCAALQGSLLTPEVLVRNVTLGRFDLSGLDVMVDLRVKNPNNLSLPLTGIEYGLELQNVKVAEGRQARAVTLPAQGETDVPLGLTVNLLTTATQLVPMFLNKRTAPKTLAYKVNGAVKLDWWYMPSLPFARMGEVPLQFG